MKQALGASLTEAEKRHYLREGELRALLYEVMGFLNSRPLGYVGNDPDDGTVLTPNHFLIGRASVDNPPVGVKIAKDLSLKCRFDFLQKVVNAVWNRWKVEYLPTLTARAKWRAQEKNLKKGDIILVTDEGKIKTARNKWLSGRVIDTKVNRDGHVRAVTVRVRIGEEDDDTVNGKTKYTEYIMPITKCILLQEQVQ